MRWITLSLLAACGNPNDASGCACPADVDGYVFARGERCLCLPKGAPTPDPPAATTFDIEDDQELDWSAIDAALAEGHVRIAFSGERGDRLEVRRSDTGPHRLILDGQGQTVVPEITTRYEDVPRHRVTVRGFEITGGSDKGVYWRAGDDILIEGNHIYEVDGSPALNLEYANRTGLPSSSFVVRNNHIHDQGGEAIYIGGAEGEDVDAHERVVIEHNLVHDIRSAWDSKTDCINVKDRIRDVLVQFNVVARCDWGIEVASPGSYSNNVVLDTQREGFQVSDAFQAFSGPMIFEDNTVYGAGHDGFHLDTGAAADGLVVRRLRVVEAGQAGVLVGGEAASELLIEDVVVERSPVGLDGWGDGSRITVDGCTSIDNELDVDRAFDGVVCEGQREPTSEPGGADGVFFGG